MNYDTKGGALGTIGRQALQGATLGFSDEIIDYPTALLVAKMTGQKPEDILAEARKMSRSDLSGDQTYAPGTSLAANIIGGLLPSAVAGPSYKAAASLGGLSAAGAMNGGAKDRLIPALIGGAFGLGGQGVAGGLNRLAKGASDLISPQTKKIIERLKEAGIPTRLSQAMDSKFLNIIDNAISKVPFSGANKSQDEQRKAATKAISNTFGESSDIIDENVLAAAKERLGSEYNKILSGKVIPIDQKKISENIIKKAKELSLETDEAGASFYEKQAKNILETINKNNGNITGEAYQDLRRTLKNAQKKDFSVGEFKKIIDDSIRESAPSNIGSKLSNIDEQYRNMKIAGKMFGQSQNSTGVFKPETLYNVAKTKISNLESGGGGSLGELARDSRLLKPTIPDSGTTSQILGVSALGTAGSLSGASLLGGLNPLVPLTALAASGATVGLSKGLNKLMASDYALNGLRPGMQDLTQKVVNSGILPNIGRAAIGALSTDPILKQEPWLDYKKPEINENAPWLDYKKRD